LSERELAVCARAALRETFEETGLLVGRAVAPGMADQPITGVWAAYALAGLAPAFARLDLVARAITPARSPIRFDTYFFAADGAEAHGDLAGDGELEDIGWVPVSTAAGLPMAEVTRLILREALMRRSGASDSGDLATFSV
jgi:8-oxo-dGTP pyrophosphatase MutT (NUDIX family)